LENNIHGGLSIEKWHPKLKNCLLFGITEMYNEDDIDRFIQVLREI